MACSHALCSISGLDHRVYKLARCRVLKQELAVLLKPQQGKSMNRTTCPAAYDFAADSALQLALLSCACELVSFLLVDPPQLFPAACRYMASSKHMLEMWEAVQMYMQHLRDHSTPAALIHYLVFIRMRILDEYAFAHGSTVYDAMHCDPQKGGKPHDQVGLRGPVAASWHCTKAAAFQG